jgi:hypothetical protein
VVNQVIVTFSFNKFRSRFTIFVSDFFDQVVIAVRNIFRFRISLIRQVISGENAPVLHHLCSNR